MDQVAHAAGQDPFEFRRRLLAKEPRMKAVLELAAAKAGWSSAPLPKGAMASSATDAQSAQAYNNSIRFNPMPALNGNPGLFTLETGEILRKGDWNQIRRASDERGGGTSKQREFHGGISRGESRSEQ